MEKEKYNSMLEGHRYFDEKRWIKFSQLIALNISLDAAIFFGYLYNVESYHFKFKFNQFKQNNFWFTFKREDVLGKINMCFSRQKRCIEELEKFKLIKTDLRQNKLKWYFIEWSEFIKKRNEWDENFILNQRERYEKYNTQNDEIFDQF